MELMKNVEEMKRKKRELEVCCQKIIASRKNKDVHSGRNASTKSGTTTFACLWSMRSPAQHPGPRISWWLFFKLFELILISAYPKVWKRAGGEWGHLITMECHAFGKKMIELNKRLKISTKIESSYYLLCYSYVFRTGWPLWRQDAFGYLLLLCLFGQTSIVICCL